MALINCKECGKEISDKADKCPNCGFPLKQTPASSQEKGQRKGRGWGTFLILALLVIITYEVLTSEPEKKSPTAPKDKEASETKSNQKPKATQAPKEPTRKFTKDGYFACVTEKSLDEAVNYSVRKDTRALAQMITSGECIILKGGIEVTIEDVKIFSGKVLVRPVGTRLQLWTVNEAITKEAITKPKEETPGLEHSWTLINKDTKSEFYIDNNSIHYLTASDDKPVVFQALQKSLGDNTPDTIIAYFLGCQRNKYSIVGIWKADKKGNEIGKPLKGDAKFKSIPPNSPLAKVKETYCH